MAVPSKEYWAARAVQREQEAYLRGSELSAKLFEEYRRAAAELRRSISDFYGKYATKHGLTYDQAVRFLGKKEMREWLADLGAYVGQINAAVDPKLKATMTAQLDALSANSQISRLEALLADTNAQINLMYDRCRSELKEQFGEIYSESYYQKHYDLQSRAGWLNEAAKLTPEMIEDAVSYPWSGAMFSDRLWQNKEALLFNIREVITQGLVQGKGLPETSKALAGKMGQSYKAAERLVRTETNHLHNRADLAAYEAAGVDEYEFMATLDSRTCEVCGALDGKRFKLSEAKTGENYPPMHPNDRCTTVEYDPEDAADWAASGKKMPESMTYEEWTKMQDTSVKTEKSRMVESVHDKVYNQGVIINDKQFGKKVGKHAADFGLDPSDKGSREKMREIIQNIAQHRDEIVRGSWRGLGGVLESGNRASGPADFLIKGRDVVVAQDGRFVTILRDGITNPHVIKAKRKGGNRQ